MGVDWATLAACKVRRHGNVYSADGWRDVLDPVIARYAKRDLMRFSALMPAYAIPAIYARLEEARYFYAIRLPANAVLREKIAHRLTRPVGRPSLTGVKRFYADFVYQAASWDKSRRVIAKLDWQPAYDFARILQQAATDGSTHSPMTRATGCKGYHDQVFEDGPFPVD